MQEHEQQSGSDDIDHSTDSSPDSKPASEVTSVPSPEADLKQDDGGTVSASPKLRDTKQSHGKTSAGGDRRPLAKPGEFLLPLILSGVIATIMIVAFVSGFDSIFPSDPVPATTPATTPESTAPTTPASSVAPAAESETAPKASTPTDTEAAPPDPVDGATKSSESSEKKTSGGQAVLSSPFLASLVRAASVETPPAATSSERIGPFGRLMVFMKFVVLILLGVACGLVALGGLALALDRPIGSLATAASRMFLAGWLTTLALLIPAPYTWMLDPLHYIVAALIFWMSMKFFFRLSFQQAATLLGGTMCLLAITALGSWVVLWAAWG